MYTRRESERTSEREIMTTETEPMAKRWKKNTFPSATRCHRYNCEIYIPLNLRLQRKWKNAGWAWAYAVRMRKGYDEKSPHDSIEKQKHEPGWICKICIGNELDGWLTGWRWMCLLIRMCFRISYVGEFNSGIHVLTTICVALCWQNCQHIFLFSVDLCETNIPICSILCGISTPISKLLFHPTQTP